MKAFFRKICTIFLLVLSALSFANDIKHPNNECKKIKDFIISKKFSDYSIPFDESEQGTLKYRIIFDKRIAKNLIANCGNGSDAICEMNLIDKNGGKIEFSLPAGIRLIEFQGYTYIVNGLIFDRNGDFYLNQYKVHRLSGNGINLICDKF